MERIKLVFYIKDTGEDLDDIAEALAEAAGSMDAVIGVEHLDADYNLTYGFLFGGPNGFGEWDEDEDEDIDASYDYDFEE